MMQWYKVGLKLFDDIQKCVPPSTTVFDVDLSLDTLK